MSSIVAQVVETKDINGKLRRRAVIVVVETPSDGREVAQAVYDELPELSPSSIKLVGAPVTVNTTAV